MASSDGENDELESVGSEVSNSVHDDDEVIRFTIDSETPVGPTHTWPTTLLEAVEPNLHRHPYATPLLL